METLPLKSPESPARNSGTNLYALKFEWWAVLYARVALGTAFLSAVASRFGLWDKTFDLNHFSNFIKYAAQVLAFAPAPLIPWLAWAATAAETALGILLIVGWWPRWVSLASATLLGLFGISMAISFGPQSPMDYSVFSASGAALLLAMHTFNQQRKQNFKHQVKGQTS
jgi:uncharacterized membrane protein YphA (DoxX/SURF4 family)